jgi:hypothetical protein
MTAVLRILKGRDVVQEVALRGVERIGGVMFYELDVDEILSKEEPPSLTKNDRQNHASPLRDPANPDQYHQLPGQTDFLHEDTP